MLQIFRYCKVFDLQNADKLFIFDKSVKTRVTINQTENLVLRAITDWNGKCHRSRNFNSFKNWLEEFWKNELLKYDPSGSK